MRWSRSGACGAGAACLQPGANEVVVMAGEDVEKVDAEKAAESIVHVLQALYTAARSILIYPPENPTIVNMLDSAYEALM